MKISIDQFDLDYCNFVVPMANGQLFRDCTKIKLLLIENCLCLIRVF